MRFRITSLLLLALSSPVISGERIVLPASISLLTNRVVVGDQPYLSVKFTNATNKRIYIDDRDLSISVGVEFPDRTGLIGPGKGRVVGSRAHGGPDPIVHLHERTVGLEPSESIIRFTRIPSYMLTNPQHLTVSIQVSFPGTSDLSMNGEDWGEYVANAEMKIVLYPENTK